jgi:uncharacterized repeat protein (TIGR03803 family)
VLARALATLRPCDLYQIRGNSMGTKLKHANLISGRLLRGPAKALLLLVALGTAAALHAQQSADESQAGTYSLLYSFRCIPDGEYPDGGLIRDSSGNLYGTTFYGGPYGETGYGTVFKVTSGGTETVLHSFAGPPSDGSYPYYGSLTLDAAGNVYGTTFEGGEFGYGTVFKVTATGEESVLHNFTGGSDGGYPYGGIARDSAGNIYGTGSIGGAYDGGVFFKLTPGGTGTVLHSFSGSPSDGASPQSDLIRDSSGNLYGTTNQGGAASAGTVFEITASGAESLLYSFKGAPVDGANPLGGGLLQDTSGNLYGVTDSGGADEAGVVFKVSPDGAESVLLNFTGITAGGAPIDGLARDAAGNLYGTTEHGGSGGGCNHNLGCGVLFGLTTTGGEKVLHNFTHSSPSDGAYPQGGVIRDPSGNLYGTLGGGGAYGCGAIFKFTP